MNWNGILIGVASFLIIGIFHPIVIKGEYYFSKRIWPIFLVLGLVFLGISLLVENALGASLLGVLGCSCLWSIGELKEQEDRVKKGWFPRNEKRKDYPF
ncbi:MAG: DUF4491 family protein [Lachnospiraceae bacterium]|nr:DUF4491 family protein [Lachnospiraceae bacterium]MCI7595075.1 DUF4491 family protein [Lachnospiraceae bacterium]MDD7051479.1 DUF4491 family protein [Lachnospiraceae bacterium]MDY3223580.1 DUF4491 family protein [Lachnospiraceae bacterium]MDY4096766.1 DUF4491 family protein [Lachnospiraceae bacterium]